MRIRVIRAFIDRHTGKPYNADYVFESDDLKRIAELQEAGYLERIPLLFSGIEKAVMASEEDAKLPKKTKEEKG